MALGEPYIERALAVQCETSPDHHNKMASSLHFIVLLCGLWIGANAILADDDECTETCPSGWTHFENQCYMFHHSEKDWADAERFCTSIGGNLASIHSAEVYSFLRDVILTSTGSHKTTWVGGHDAVKEGVWLWSDGSKFEFKGWAKGEPNNAGGGENCMEINFKGKDFVNDSKCNLKRSFVCSKQL
ncbi:galactose-specific lectin nattectin-like isoform X1 [Thunnus thynnus]|uniref:galactose-specific lectin nattectin-like isoform X1 n=1 Tax=Thunnus thynnus TaxID=8237 RepID=UPI003527E623